MITAIARFHLSALAPRLEAQIRAHCEQDYPNEACGAIIGRGDGINTPWLITTVSAAPNNHDDDQRRRYLIPPDFQASMELAARASGEQVLGFYHSHPDHPAEPSEFDRSHAWFGYLYMICSVQNRKAIELNAFALDQDNGQFLKIKY